MTSFTISQKRSTAIHNGQRWGAKPNIPSNRTLLVKMVLALGIVTASEKANTV
jgi:hypothetical protein